MIIDWNKLQPYKTTKSKSFEQLCYQVAVRQYASDGNFTPIDDSGGGDGVEFFLTFDDGSQWGWQAKYYEGLSRLSVSGRKTAIASSLERATEKHPDLKIWYLCLTMDLTLEEGNWVNTELVKHIPQGHPVKIVIWDESFLHEKLNQPAFNGLKQAFFNQLELSSDWFRRSFEKSFSIVKNKFDELLYTPNDEFEYYYVNPVLCNKKFVSQRIAYYPRKLDELYKEATEKLKDLHYTNDLWRPLFNEFINRYSEFNIAVEKLMPALKARLENITPNNFEKLSGEKYSEEINLFQSIASSLDDFRRDWYHAHVSNTTEDQKRSNIEQSSKVSAVERVYNEFVEELKYYVSHSELPIKWRSANFLGNGGDGKTNFSVALVKEFIDNELPAIYIPAILFTGDNPLSDQLLTILDIKSDYTFGDLLDCLDELGKIYNRRIPLILDGLNEAINAQGVLNERLSLDLPQLETEFLHRTNLVLITTCRTSYQEAIWGDVKNDDKRFHPIYGFTNHEDKKKLVRNYFKHYKIQSDLSFLSLERFTKPLYLKLFCESVNSERKELKQVTLGFDSIYSIFENFVSLCDANVFKRIKKAGKLPPTSANKQLASKVLSKIGEQLWIQHQRAFLLDDLMNIADGKTVEDYSSSITKALLDEELLFVRNWQSGDEYVFLTYDLLAGYFIAKHLLRTVDDFSAFFNGEQVESVLSKDYEKLHPNHEDILDGLCSLLPIEKGIFVHDLIAKSGKQQQGGSNLLFERSIAATILLSPSYIPMEQVDYIQKLAVDLKNLIWLITLSEDVLFVIDHPFNFKFWSSRLADIPLNERDVTWSEYLRKLRAGFLDELINEFEALQTNVSLTDQQREKIFLVADYLKWTLTSTNKRLKQKTGDALYQFSINFPAVFLKDYYGSAKLNDPSIFEWMTGVLYNTMIVLVKRKEESYLNDFMELSKFLFHEVLDPKGAYATNHLTTRNYSFSMLKLLARKVKAVGQYVDLGKILKNLSLIGITDWKVAADKNEGEYRDGNSLIGYYFNKDKMPYICRGHGSEYDRTPGYLAIQAKLRWRAYELGYQFELFGEIDKEIANRQHWGEDFSDTERYADKYIEIAFLEYCGFLDGQDDLETYGDIGYIRTFKLKHDPSEKVEIEEESLPPIRFMEKSFIDKSISLKKWCNDRSVPDLSEYLERSEFQGKVGRWVLLDGLVHQHSKPDERQFFFKVDTVFVKNPALMEARKAFTAKTALGQGNNSIPYTQNIHESEIPDAESIPYNEFTEWHYSLETNIVEREYTKMVLLEDGERLEEKDAELLWNSVIKQLHFMPHPRTSVSGHTMPMELQ